MLFRINQPIQECNGRQTRWLVTDCRPDPTLTFVKLSDQHRDIDLPMVRSAVGVCINYFRHRVDDWLVGDWRRQFTEAIEAASGNFAGLPEPMDYFHIRTTDREVPQHLQEDDPFFVYCYSQAEEVFPLNPHDVRNAEDLSRRIKTFVYDLAYILRALNDQGLVLRQLPLISLRYLKSSRKYFLGEFLSLCKQGPSNYYPIIPFLTLVPGYSAPECFDPAGQLTPATDVFALGKTLLMWLGKRFRRDDPPLVDVAQTLHEIDVKFQPLLPEATVRFLKLRCKRIPVNVPETCPT